MSVTIEIVEDPARACAAMLLGAVTAGGNVVLSGGSTPKAAYEELVRAVHSAGVDVSGATLWFGDERCVPPDDERSNYLMVLQSLLEPLGEGNQPVVHRMRGEEGPFAAADAYEQVMRAAGPPRFDIVLNGIGPDGHTASLFPDQETLQERSRLVVGVEQAGLEPYVPRVTMTLPALVAADKVVYLASGEDKAAAVAAAFGPDARPDPHVPSSMVAAEAEDLVVLLDEAAAARL